MDKEDKRLDRLDNLLHALPFETMPMALSELDGYVTGLLACPEMISRLNGSPISGAKPAMRSFQTRRPPRKPSGPSWNITILSPGP